MTYKVEITFGHRWSSSAVVQDSEANSLIETAVYFTTTADMSTTVNELVALLEETTPPKPLLVYHPKFYAPKYIVDSVTELTGR